MNQCKKDVVKEEMVRVNMDILGISELTQMGIKENEVKVLVTQSCLTLFDSMDYIAHQALLPMGFSRQ